MDITSLIIGAFVGASALLFIGVMLFVIKMILDAPYTYLVRVIHLTNGRETPHLYAAKKVMHDKLGEVLYSNKRKKETNSPYMPFFGSSKQYDMHGFKNYKHYVPMTFCDGSYAPEDHVSSIKVKQKQILFDFKGKPYLEEREVDQYVSKPLNSSTRSWNLINDTEIKEDYKKEENFWVKNAALVISGLMILGAVAVVIFMLIYGGEYQKTLLSQSSAISEQTATRVIQMINEGNTSPSNPPPTGGAGIPIIGGLVS